MFATPFYCNETNRLIAAGVDGAMYCFEPKGNPLIPSGEPGDMTLRWRESVSESPIFSSPSKFVNKGDASTMIVGSHDGFVRRISLCGDILWKVDVGGAVFSSPFCCLQWSIVTTTAGDIVVLDNSNGTVKTRRKMAAEIYSSAVLNNGCVFVGCRDDFIHCLRS